MKVQTKKKFILLYVVLAALILAATIDTTMSYFTTYTKASGGQKVTLGYSTTVEETFSAGVKHVTITNNEDSADVFVRAKAFTTSSHPVSYGGTGWSSSAPSGTKSDGVEDYWYYAEPLAGGTSTDPLDVKVTFPEGAKEDDSFNVVVIYESTPAKYTEDGMAYADWTTVLTIKQSRTELYSVNVDQKGGHLA